jgi:ATP-binding cassette subfamily F protein 3
MIRLVSIGKRFGARELFADVTLLIRPGDRIGLVGANGAGKTTLLKILAKDITPDDGQLVLPQGARIGLMRQETGALESATPLLSFAVDGAEHIVAAHHRVERLATAIESAPLDKVEALAHDLADAEEIYKNMGGYALEGTAKSILGGLGFTDTDFTRPLGAFSGGWRMRAQLARLLVSSPDLLLLDEPTNHLDLESAVWLESFLVAYEKAVVIISHDRYFLNRMVNAIAEMERGKMTFYPYPFDKYLEEKQRRMENANAAADRQDKDLARQQEFIDRFRAKASKAKAVQSRVKKLEKIERVQRIGGGEDKVRLRFAGAGRVGATPVALTEATAGYGDVKVFRDLSFILRRGDRIALLGVNGAGKSTLLKVLSGQLPLMSGALRIAESVSPAYFAQSQTEALDLNKKVLDEVCDNIPYDAIPRARGVLGALGLDGHDVGKQVKVLSGGEKSRAALAKIALTPTNLLLLDEPTNHLDLASRQALEDALTAYEGAIIFVSHDRAFIDKVCTKIVYLDHGDTIEYLGDYGYFETKRAEMTAKVAADTADSPPISAESPPISAGNGKSAERKQPPLNKKEARREAAKLREKLKETVGPIKKELAVTEEKIARSEARIAAAESALADPANSADIANKSKELATAREDYSRLMRRWETLAEEVENMKAEIGL